MSEIELKFGVPPARAGAIDTALRRAEARRQTIESRYFDTPDHRLAQAGRARVLSHHTWAASMHKLDGIIDRCLALARRAGSGRADGAVEVGMRE